MTDDLDPSRSGDNFTGSAAPDIAAALDSEIDNDRSGSQLGDHVAGQQHRRLASRNEGSADDDVGALQYLGDLLVLSAPIILIHFAGIAFGGFRGAGRRFIDGDEAG